MRDLISGALFKHHKRMSETFIKSRIVRGSSSKVEQSMRTAGWNPLNPSAAVAVYISEKSGRINAAKLVLAGSLEAFEVEAKSIFPEAPEDSVIVFSNLNLNALRFKTSEMATRWISDKDFKWTCVVEGLDENGQAEQVPVTPTNFGKFGISNLCLKVHAQPISSTKIKLSFGAVPCSLEMLKAIADYDNLGFPFVDINVITVDIFPIEDPKDKHGIGFSPYILESRREETDISEISSSEIKSAACDLLARAIMPSSKKTGKTWRETVDKGDWSARPSSKEWPAPLDTDDEDEQLTDISGELSVSSSPLCYSFRK